MQTCFLVANKETHVASYLQHRSIIDVTEEHRSLIELNMDSIGIIDVDKFIYIYYQTDDSDLSFRSDMNVLRNLMSSAFFHTSEVLFILVNNENPLLEDLIFSALRDSTLPREKIEIIQHTGPLMLPDVGTYISGSAAGQTTSSSYRDVFVREADKEEKERFTNQSSGLNSVLPVLTDMAALYRQRVDVEALSAGRMVSEQSIRPSLVKDFTRVSIDIAKTMSSFVVSGERWSEAEQAVRYLVEYYHTLGRRVFIVNMDTTLHIAKIIGECSTLEVIDIRAPITPEHSVACIDIRYNQLGYIVEYLRNIKGVEEYIFYASQEDYGNVLKLIRQLSEVTCSLFVAHYHPDSIQSFVERGIDATALFLNFSRFKKDFDLQFYKNALKGVVVAEFPKEDVDYIEFHELATGGEQHE